MAADNAAEGKFIVFEGIDGSGLTTHAKRLYSWLNRLGDKQAYLTKEPTGGPIGAQIRASLAGRLSVDEATLALLFAADRMDHLNVDIIPKLKKGIHVVCDRYYLSSLAYQSLALDVDWIEAINAKARRPDLTVLLDVSAAIAIDRIIRERHTVEFFETQATLERVRSNFHRIATQSRGRGENIVIVRGFNGTEAREIGDVESEIREAVQAMLSESSATG